MVENQEKSIKELLEEIPEDKLELYKKGYEDGKNEYTKKLREKNKLDLFIEGYKAGYRDGYMTLMKNVIKETGQVQFDSEGQPGWPWPKGIP